jgi:hypothetical protein
MALRRAEDADWEAMTGMPAPSDWFGLVEASNYLIEGMGAIYRDMCGRWWFAFQRVPFAGKIKTAHKAAKVLLNEAAERGIEVRAIADPRIDGSQLWIERLGFKKTDEEIEGHAVWLIQ